MEVIRYIEYIGRLLDLYTPGLPDESQCSGYIKFKELCLDNTKDISENLNTFHVLIRVQVGGSIIKIRHKIKNNET